MGDLNGSPIGFNAAFCLVYQLKFPVAEYNFVMSVYHFYHPIEVRYGDLDPQGHLNNARYLTYMEQARINYLRQLGLWRGDSFFDIGIIMADFHITYLAPVYFGQQVQVGAKVTRMGNKSMEMHYTLEDTATGKELAKAYGVLVAYDYKQAQSIPIPAEWRLAIAAFEGLKQI